MRKTAVKAGSDGIPRALAAALLFFAGIAAGAEFRQEHLVLGFWGDPPVDGLVNARYAEVAEAGFNIVMGGLGASSPALAQRQRDACNRVNIRVLFATYGLPVKALCNCETTYGFLVRDHPSLGELDTLRSRVEEVRRERPGKLPFINLAPPSTPPEKLGAPDYDAYVQAILKTLRPEILCWDELPWAMPGEDGPKRYEEALKFFRDISMKQGTPFWTFVQAMAYGTDYEPTEGDIRWQVHTALAYGAKGILYFSYATPVNDPKTKGSGMIDPDGRKTERYRIVSGINREIKKVMAVLFRSVSVGVFNLQDAEQARALSETVPSVQFSSGIPVTVGVLRDVDGSMMLYTVNRNCAESAAVSLSSEVPVSELDWKSGKLAPLKNGAPIRDNFQLGLDPGDARILVLKGVSSSG